MNNNLIKQNIPSGWHNHVLSDLCVSLDNRRIPITKSDRVSGDVPYYGATGIIDYVHGYTFDEEILLIGEDGADWSPYTNKAFIVRGKSWVNNHAHVLKCKAISSHEYLEQYLNWKNLDVYTTGGTRKKLNKEVLMSIPVCLPESKKEQQKIAEILGTVDEDIAKTQEVIKATEKLKRGLMQQLLSNSDNLKSISFSELVELRKEKSKPKEDNDEKYIALEHLGQGTGSLLDIGHSSDTKSINSVFKKGDILFAKLRPYLRKYWKAEFDGICTSELLVFIPKLQSDTDFIFQLVQSESFIQHSVSKSFGTKMPRTDWGIVSEFAIQVPPPKRRQQIGEILSAVDEKISVNKKLKEKLTLLKKGLMQDLLSGKVRTNI